MSKTNANPQSELGAEDREGPHRKGAGPKMKQTMAQMMAHCPCGPEMMARMAALMAGCEPSDSLGRWDV